MRKPTIDLETLESLINSGLSYARIAERLNCSKWSVMQNCRYYGIRSKAGNNFTEDVVKRIEDAKNEVWSSGEYLSNAPLGTGSLLNLGDDVKSSWAKQMYFDYVNCLRGFDSDAYLRKSLICYSPDGVVRCAKCGAIIPEGNEHVNNIDGSLGNILLSNFEPLCSECYEKLKWINTPFTTVTSTFRFDSAHYLPFHNKKCKFLHGHSYKLEVTVRRRVDPETGMVIDFGKLKKVVRRQIEEVFDHGYLNNYISMPTSENIILWIWAQLSFEIKGLHKLRLYETENNYSELTVDDVLEFVKSYDPEGLLNDDKCLADYKAKQEALDLLIDNKLNNGDKEVDEK